MNKQEFIKKHFGGVNPKEEFEKDLDSLISTHVFNHNEYCECSYPIDSCNGTGKCSHCGKKLSLQQLMEIGNRPDPSYQQQLKKP